MSGVLVIGSGPIVIGQAAEFDYSGTQACLACRERGVRSILVNSNPATIQTDPHIADVVYIEPLTLDSLTQIIARERPDGLIATVGGQTALNLAVALAEAGVLTRYGVRILGTGLEAIRRGEDRALFAATLRHAGQPILPSRAVSSVDEARAAADEIGYPVMCRSAFALGGAGSGFATNPEELARQVAAGLRSSGSGQVLIEKSVQGWAELEYEVIRDGDGNCLVVCNMENVDPMGVHTGDSIVVAPSQTLSDDEYHALRTAAREVVHALGVEGACNVQFALDRRTGDYFVIEVNPRLSRSSALASKATGYPIAKVATRIALGQSLPEIRNDITGTSAFFEPALDYVVVKIPRWPFDKFTQLNPAIGTSMRSTGEVMAIGRTFGEAMGKALRSLDAGTTPVDGHMDRAAVTESWLTHPNGHRLAAVLAALGAGMEPAEVARLTQINPWFVDQLALSAGGQPSLGLQGVAGDATGTRHGGRGAFGGAGSGGRARDTEVAGYGSGGNKVGGNGSSGNRAGGDGGISYRMVDTCAAEFEARTPYFYGSSHGGENEAAPLPGPKAIILGAGPIRIGQGVEFDYATVHACHALSAAGVRSIVVNNNPETVSTDYATSDRLYFEPLDVAAVAAIAANEAEGLLGIIPQFGGQTAINLVHPLHELGIPILGTSPAAIDATEDRSQTSALLAELGVLTPAWRAVEHWLDLPAAAAQVGFPVLLRPSYVLSGQGMTIARSAGDVRQYLNRHGRTPLARPLLVDQFIAEAVELNVDAVSDGQDILAIIMEQLDECGVHSGDSAEVYPVQNLSPRVVRTVEAITRQVARALGILGLMNVQYAVRGSRVYVLEINPRASRSVPFASKASGIPLADLAIRVILGARLADLNLPGARTDRVCVKNVVLPFRVFPALDPVLGPEMQSTGESMGLGPTFAAAYWKAWLGAGLKELPCGKPIYVSLPESLADASLRDAAAAVSRGLGGPIVGGAAEDVDVAALGLAIVLGRRPADLDLLRRAVVAGVPHVSTAGGLRGLARATGGGIPTLISEALCA